MPAISELNYDSRFVDLLPGDPVQENRRRQVKGACYSRVRPTPVAAPETLALVPEVAELLDLGLEETPELARALGGNEIVPGMAPYAACYGGHQFGSWAGQLGDGRAITLGEVVNGRGERWEMQLKGAGPTPYSRTADGRAVLRSSLRELVSSEAMYHLRVPTTRALSLVATGEGVERDLLYDGHSRVEPGAVVCRVAPSFLRFGSYEIHAARGDRDTLLRLVRFTVEHYFPRFIEGDSVDVPAFLEEVTRRTARLVADWQRIGFVHGVMNTDNMSILGLTIDYGPYGWMDVYDEGWTPNITDASGRRYRYGNQPKVAHWNLFQLARALTLLVPEPAPLERALGTYEEEFARAHRRAFLAKLGLRERADRAASDDELVLALREALEATETDMTLFFRRLAAVPTAEDRYSLDGALEALRDAYYDFDGIPPAARAAIGAFFERYLERAREEGGSDAERTERMNAVNPLYVPRNYLVQLAIDRVEQGDRDAVRELLDVLRKPYDERPGHEAFAARRPEWARDRPGCSMLSCSS